jgi:hypothetical protein
MCVVGAIIGAGALGAIGTSVAGHEAASATRDSTNAAINQQNQALAQQAQLSAPYRALGQQAIPQLQALLGLGGANPQAALAATPGYQFDLSQGLQGVTNQASRMGMGLSGNTLEGLQKFGTGLADKTYQQAVGNIFDVTRLGQNAAAGQATNVGQAGTNISNALIGQGQTSAGIDANTLAGITKALGGVGNNLVLNNTLAGLGGGFNPNMDYGTGATAGLFADQGLNQIAPIQGLGVA